MKKFTIIPRLQPTAKIIILAFCFLPFGVFAQFGGGNGDPGTPYQIANAAHLTELANKVNAGDAAYITKHYILTNNIDLSGNDNWIPIGTYSKPFHGVFDGNNNVIKELQINNTVLTEVGLFGCIKNGIIKNLGVINADITSNSDSSASVGGIAGWISTATTIENCYFKGIVSNFGKKSLGMTGGVAGCITTNSKISNCFSTGVIVSEYLNFDPIVKSYIGGIVGNVAESSVTACYSTAGLVGENSYHNDYIGGVAGYVMFGTVTNCAALNSNINSHYESTNIGRVVGFNFNNESTLSNNVAFNKMADNEGNSNWLHHGHNNLDGESINVQFINSNSTLGDRFIEANGWITEAGKLPVLFGNTMYMPVHLQNVNGDNADPYLIYAPEQLKSLSDYVYTENATLGKYYTLMNDIDLSDYPNWIPIGSAGFLFSKDNINIGFIGVFDGNQNKITGLRIKDTRFNVAGLFGIMLGGMIKNVGIEDADIRNGMPNSFAGGVVGVILGGKVLNCYFTGIVSTNCSTMGTGISATGGIAGLVLMASITNCYSLGSVNSTALFLSAAGGVAGLNMGQVLNCYSTGIVSNNSVVLSTAGGIIGIIDGCKISNCAALNPGIVETGVVGFYGRIVGNILASSIDTLINNVAFSGLRNPFDMLEWKYIGLTELDGADFTAQQINADGTLGGRFTSVNGWTTENGKLPGLFGKAVDMPLHLQYVGVAETHCNESLQVYPNPTTGELRIMNNEQLTMINVEVYDVYGKRIEIPRSARNDAEETKFPSNSLEGWQPQADGVVLNLSNLPAGIYFFKIETENGYIVKKIIKI
jgi:hypothetical protein